MVLASVVLLSGCAGSEETPGESGLATFPAATAAAPPAPSAAATASPSATTMDAGTKKACTALLASVKKSEQRINKAEKIGGPAGHIAVGAEYLASSAEMSAQTRGVTDPEVMDAAGKVSKQMTALDAAWQKNPGKKPSEKALNSAVADLKAACTAG